MLLSTRYGYRIPTLNVDSLVEAKRQDDKLNILDLASQEYLYANQFELMQLSVRQMNTQGETRILYEVCKAKK